ncbi:Lrp/AsnC ligand binding domain-containing protein [Rhizobium leguminosarum]|uniref:Lrp/AsnC ligand binding domain-containing protein n=1 Tax=Rhizobium leguminosarum TaxID=384 RepID=A0ACD5FGQ3_RHILE|nr:Lrp/AsnC ligand binding domain-containing protein [Rhizobium leguminosarum]
MPEVIACHLVSGDHDLLEVVIPDMATYEATVPIALLALPAIGVIRTSSRCAPINPTVRYLSTAPASLSVTATHRVAPASGSE